MNVRSLPSKFRPGRLTVSQELATQVLENLEIFEDLDLENVLQKTVRAMVELTGADFSRIFLFDESDQMLHSRAFFGVNLFLKPPNVSYQIGEGFAGKAFALGETICMGDLRGQPGFVNADWCEKERMRSFIVHPILYRDRKIGVMNCFSRKRDFFEEENVSILSIFSSRVAIALQNAWLHEEVGQRASRLDVLRNISRKLNEHLELSDIFEAIANGSEEMIGATRCHVSIREEDFGQMEFLYTRGLSREYLDSLRERYDLTLVATAESTLEPVFVGDIFSDPRYAQPHNLAISEGIGAILVTPLVCKSKSFGMLTLYWDEKRKLSPAEISLAKIFSDQAATAIQNAEYHAEAVRNGRFFQSVFQENSDAIIIVAHPSGLITHWNAAAEKLYGYSADEILGQSIKTIFPPGMEEFYLDMRDRVIGSDESGFYDAVRVSKNGVLIPVRLAVTRIKNEVGEITAVVTIHRDISEQKQREDALRKASSEFETLARTDTLTGLFNRRVLTERLNLEMSRAQRYGSPLSLLILDIDHFKSINDTHGHPVGDMVLSGSAEVISILSRDSDVPARYGGEEFFIVLPETDLAGSLLFAERLQLRFAEKMYDGINGDKFGVACSIGLTEFRKDEDDESSIMARADAALYQAKETGRDRICTA